MAGSLWCKRSSTLTSSSSEPWAHLCYHMLKAVAWVSCVKTNSQDISSRNVCFTHEFGRNENIRVRPKAIGLEHVSTIHLLLASPLHQNRTINFNWILMVYVTGHELNIRLSSVQCTEFACPANVMQDNMNDQAGKSFECFVPHLSMHQNVSYRNIWK